MINFDFDTYLNKYIDKDIFKKFYDRKEEVFEKFNNSKMVGWSKDIDKNIVEDIIKIRDEIRNNSSCLVVIGIGGSYLGSLAINSLFDSKFEIVYLGNNLSSKYILDTFKYLEDKDFYVNVISKSGTTMEIQITYSLLLDFMKKKYSEEEIVKRTIITTDSVKGKLREEVRCKNYRSFVIPDDIGGRYSLITPAHLLPLSFNIDIKKLITGFREGLNLKEEAYLYAVSRRSLFKIGKYIENFSVYEPSFSNFLEWIKQLLGETEGKNNKGIFPVSTIGTRDLHSLGQFIQDGHSIIFETFIKIKNINNNIKFKNIELDKINNLVLDSVVEAHLKNNVFSSIIEINSINEETIGILCAFFMLSAAYSGYLFDVEPFNQPGVEIYKECVKNNLSEALK